MATQTDTDIDEAFKKFDADGSGCIDANELKDVVKLVYPDCSDEDVANIAGVSRAAS